VLDGGSETTAGAMRAIVMMMTVYPEVQNKLSEELERVVGDRIPTLEDAKDLPYLNAFMNEVRRACNVALVSR
jgi:cytochrome P450